MPKKSTHFEKGDESEKRILLENFYKPNYECLMAP